MTVSGRNKKADPTNMSNFLKQSRRGSSGGGGGNRSAHLNIRSKKIFFKDIQRKEDDVYVYY